jgi:hypothetical protein
MRQQGVRPRLPALDSPACHMIPHSQSVDSFIGRHIRTPSSNAENGIFEPFIYKNEHFAKTGSGQT